MNIDQIKESCKIYLCGGVTNHGSFFTSIPLAMDIKTLRYVRKNIDERIEELKEGEP